MKCGIIKKITSPPSHVIMSDSGGGGGSEEEAPFSIPDQRDDAPPPDPSSHALRDCLRRWRGRYRATGRHHKRTLLSGGNGGGGGGAVQAWLLGRPSRGDSELARKKATGAVVWNMFDIGPQWPECFRHVKIKSPSALCK